MKIICATGNLHKVGEIESLFNEARLTESVEVCGADVVGGMPYVDENADTFQGNALLKAQALQNQAKDIGAWVLSDDSGLSVDFLGGAPGVYSARYAGVNASDSENVDKLLDALDNVGETQRAAKFVCSLCLISPSGEVYQADGFCEGLIAREVRGSAGFGYDPIFVPNGYSETFGELGQQVKDQLSHRAEAIKLLVAQLRS